MSFVVSRTITWVAPGCSSTSRSNRDRPLGPKSASGFGGPSAPGGAGRPARRRMPRPALWLSTRLPAMPTLRTPGAASPSSAASRPRQEVGPAAVRVHRRTAAVGDRVAHRHDGARRRLRPHVDARQIEPLRRVAFVVELPGADVIARRRHVGRRQPGDMHGGRRRRPPDVARHVEIDDQVAERRHREGHRIAQHRRARLDGDRRVAAEGQVDAHPDGGVLRPRGEVGRRRPPAARCRTGS